MPNSGDRFVWVGPLVGDWTTAANWQDLTTPANTGITVPGSLDTAVFNSSTVQVQTIDGAGTAAALSFAGDNAIAGTLIAGSLVLAGAGATSINVGSTATFEVGMAGGAAAGVLTVDAGATLSAANFVSVNAPVVNAGSILVAGEFFPASLSGAGVVQVDTNSLLSTATLAGSQTISLAANADLTVQAIIGTPAITLGNNDNLKIGGPAGSATIAAGASIVLAGTGDIVTLLRPPGTTALGAISGFATGDAILVAGTITSATDSGAGLVLQNGGSVVGTLDLLGDYAADNFLTVPIPGAGKTEIVLSPNAAAPPSPGAGGHSFVWSGPIAGDWNVAGNWNDLTATANPAAIAPGSLDTVSFNTPAGEVQVLLGNGHAANAAFTGDNAIGGTLTLGTLTQSSGSITVLAGAMLQTGTTTIDGNVSLNGASAHLGTFDITTVSVGGRTALSASNTADLQASNLALGGAGGITIAIDPTSTIELGSAGGAAAGVLTVDAGATLAAAASVTVNAIVANAGSVLVTGTLLPAGFSGTGQIQVAANALLNTASLAGGETIALAADAALAVGTSILGSQTITLANAATLDAPATIASGSTITLAGTSDVLNFIDDPANTALGAIAGFGGSDVITVPGSLTSATDSGAGLVLHNGASIVGTLDLVGNFATDSFVAVPIPGAGLSQVVLAPGSLATGSAGAGGHDFVWNGPIVGDWNVAGNWNDLTAPANPATVAPGSLDNATVNGPTSAVQVILGNAHAATATLNGNDALAGVLTAGTIVQPSGNLQVVAGATLNAVTATISADLAVSGSNAAALFGELDLFANPSTGQSNLNLTNTADIQAASVVLGGTGEISVTIDSTATMEVGHEGGATAGELTVDAGSTLSAASNDVVNAGVANFGTIDITGALFPVSESGSGVVRLAANSELNTGTLLGNQTISVGSNATLAVGIIVGSQAITLDNNASLTLGTGTIGAGSLVTLTGTGDVITFDANPGTTERGGIAGFDMTDTIIVAGTVTAANPTGSGLALLDGGADLGTVDLLGNFVGRPFATTLISSGTQTRITLQPPCFTTGTRFSVGDCDVAVEDLRVGDRLAGLISGQAQPIVWIGHRRVDCRRHARPQDVWPIRIAPHAFGPGQPRRPLFLSPDHAVFMDGVLIPVRYLVNGTTIKQVAGDEVTYWHVELPRHDVILAEGLPTESYLETGNRGAFANGGGVVALHPDFALRVWATEACAKLILAGPSLTAARAGLLHRATALGFPVTDDADLHVLAAGQVIRPTPVPPMRHFVIPPGARGIRLRSRGAVPAELRPDGSDRRRLGVAISAIVLAGQRVALDDPRLGAGWHGIETAGGKSWRWTDGDAWIDLQGGAALAVEIAYTERYWLHEPAREQRRSG